MTPPLPLREQILNLVRAAGLKALFSGDLDTWSRATDILMEEGRRIRAQKKEMANA